MNGWVFSSFKFRPSLGAVLGKTVSDTTDYIGPVIYEGRRASTVRFEGGYASFSPLAIAGSKPAPTFHYYIPDYLGNNRAVVNVSTGAMEQITHYYPWGGVYADLGTGAAVQPFKYGDKELDLTNGIARYDYTARAYVPATLRFDRIDPLAAKHPDQSPYVFCANNPVNNIDPDGREAFWGQIITADMERKAVLRVYLNFIPAENLSKDQNNNFKKAIADEFSRIISENFNDGTTGELIFTNNAPQFEQSLLLNFDQKGSEIAGMTLTSASIVNVADEKGAIKSAQTIGIDGTHEILHALGLGHPFDENDLIYNRRVPEDVQLVEVGKNQYRPLMDDPSNLNNIVNNVMCYSSTIVNGIRPGIQDRLTNGQMQILKTIIPKSKPKP